MRVRDLGTLLMVSLVVPRQPTWVMGDLFAGQANLMRAAMGREPLPQPDPKRPAWTPAGARERLYDTYRERWIERGDLDDLEQMIRHVR